MEALVLDTIIARILEVTDPERILLFGSAAQDELGPRSVFDLLRKGLVEERLSGIFN